MRGWEARMRGGESVRRLGQTLSQISETLEAVRLVEWTVFYQPQSNYSFYQPSTVHSTSWTASDVSWAIDPWWREISVRNLLGARSLGLLAGDVCFGGPSIIWESNYSRDNGALFPYVCVSIVYIYIWKFFSTPTCSYSHLCISRFREYVAKPKVPIRSMRS